MSEKIFLQEMVATAAFFDVRRFSVMAAQLGPVDVGVVLRRYYEHIEAAVLAHEGRILKFMSDGVLALFPSIGDRDHAGDGLAALRRLGSELAGWLAENERLRLPVIEYSSGMASGALLYGELGTAKLRAIDALGMPVIHAIRLSRLATIRKVPHLVAASTIQAARRPEDAPSIETEDAEIGAQRVRLFRLLGERETAAGAPE
jgi:adenylate cyclase